jgi:hypothetical protein
MLTILAWIVVITVIMKVVVTPLMIGEPVKKTEYDYGNFIAALIDAAILIPLCLRVLGWI